MALMVKKVELWRREVESRPGLLADVLGTLADAGANLEIAMAYRYPGNQTMGAIEVYPISGKKRVAAAEAAGLRPLALSALRVDGTDRRGTGRAIARALADAGLDISFLVSQVIGRKFTAIFGFDTEAEAAKAWRIIRKVRV
jgi:predicted amino acid-binding ACT domain protein